MLTGWLWIHSPDRHRGVDVVNRSLGLESTSSVVNKRLQIPQVHQHKKGKTTLTTAENSAGEVQKIDHAPTRLLVDRSTSSTFPRDPFLAVIIQSTTELFWNLRLLFAFEWSPCIVPGNRKKVHWGEEESLKRPRISGLASRGEEKRRSIDIMMMRMRHDAMSGCAG